MTGTSHGFLALLAALLITASAAMASQAQVVTVDPASGLVSVESDGVSLQALLEQMSAATPFALLRLEPAIRERPVHVSIQAASMKEAVFQILTAARAGFVISGPQNGHGLRIVATRDEFLQAAASSLEKTPGSGEGPDEGGRLPRVKPEDAAAKATVLDEAAETGQDPDSVNQAGEQLVRALTGNGFAVPRGGVVLLPFFPAAGGGAMTAIAAAPGSIVELPFPGQGGALLTAVVPAQEPRCNSHFAQRLRPHSSRTPKSRFPGPNVDEP